MNNGAFIMARQVLESDIWTSKPAWWFKVWVYILSRVNYSDNGQFNRGENFFTLESIHHNCYLGKEGIKIKTVSNIIREMKLLHMLTTQKTTRGFIISVTNYDKYQDLTEYRNDTEKAVLTTQKRHRNDTIIEQGKISKVSKEDKEGFTKPTLEEVSDYCLERNNGINPENFIDSNTAKGWVVGKTKTPMKDRKAVIRTWEQNSNKPQISGDQWENREFKIV